MRCMFVHGSSMTPCRKEHGGIQNERRSRSPANGAFSPESEQLQQTHQHGQKFAAQTMSDLRSTAL